MTRFFRLITALTFPVLPRDLPVSTWTVSPLTIFHRGIGSIGALRMMRSAARRTQYLKGLPKAPALPDILVAEMHCGTIDFRKKSASLLWLIEWLDANLCCE